MSKSKNMPKKVLSVKESKAKRTNRKPSDSALKQS